MRYFPGEPSGKQKKIMLRKQIPKEFCWDIDSLYSQNDKWRKDCLRIEELLESLQKAKNNFWQDAHTFFNCLQIKDEISKLIQKIYTYAHMRKDENNKNNLYQTFYYQACTLLAKVEKFLSFIEPEIISIEYDKINKWMQENQQWAVYKHYLDNIYRKKEHILSSCEELIIAQTQDMAQVFEYAFELLSYADLIFPKVKDEKGVITTITHSNFITLLQDKRREFRKSVYQKYYQVYYKHRNIYATLLAGSIKKDQFYSSVRRYKNSLEAALFKDNIPTCVYTNLIDRAKSSRCLLHKYIKLKCNYLHLENLAMYDLYVPLVEEKFTVDYQDAQKIILESLQPIGKWYLAIVEEGFRERWIDVYENVGKTSGAYSTGCYGSKPFILMNYQGNLEDVYTLAHELGHSVHSYLTNKNQPFVYSDISIFLAEIASIVNEVLLTYYLLSQFTDKKKKILIINHFLEQFRTTFFRQVMFAEFELFLHQVEEKGEALTADILSNKYSKLNRLYYGENVIIDKEIGLEWARIPHFFYHYYVYQYATGFAIAITLSRKILLGETSWKAKYNDFLKQGSSLYPVIILKNMGIDLTNTYYLEDCLDLFAELLKELEDI